MASKKGKAKAKTPAKAPAKKAAPKKPAVKAAAKAKAKPAKAAAGGGDSAQLAALQRDLDAALERADRMASERDAVSRERDAMARERDAVLSEREGGGDEAGALRERLEAAEQRARDAQAELDKLHADQLTDSIERDKRNKRVTELEGTVAALRKKMTESVAEGEELRVALHAAEVGLASYKLRCPKCGKNFEEELYEGITIDRCTGCAAIYFDAGEVELLIAKINQPSAPGAPPATAEQKAGFWSGLFRRKPKDAKEPEKAPDESGN